MGIETPILILFFLYMASIYALFQLAFRLFLFTILQNQRRHKRSNVFLRLRRSLCATTICRFYYTAFDYRKERPRRRSDNCIKNHLGNRSSGQFSRRDTFESLGLASHTYGLCFINILTHRTSRCLFLSWLQSDRYNQRLLLVEPHLLFHIFTGWIHSKQGALRMEYSFKEDCMIISFERDWQTRTSLTSESLEIQVQMHFTKNIYWLNNINFALSKNSTSGL